MKDISIYSLSNPVKITSSLSCNRGVISVNGNLTYNHISLILVYQGLYIIKWYLQKNGRPGWQPHG